MSGHGSPGRLDVEISSLGPGEPGVTGPGGRRLLFDGLAARACFATLASLDAFFARLAFWWLLCSAGQRMLHQTAALFQVHLSARFHASTPLISYWCPAWTLAGLEAGLGTGLIVETRQPLTGNIGLISEKRLAGRWSARYLVLAVTCG